MHDPYLQMNPKLLSSINLVMKLNIYYKNNDKSYIFKEHPTLNHYSNIDTNNIYEYNIRRYAQDSVVICFHKLKLFKLR